MKKIIFALLSVAAFVACSNDEVIPSHNSAIEFNPTTKNSVRTIATTTNNISKFNVWSYTAEGKTVMDNIEVSNATGEWAYSPVKYWPYDAELDFYGITPTTLPIVEGTVSHHVDVEVAAGSAKINFAGASVFDMHGESFYCKNYPDILYATALNLTKSNNNGTKVTMNFRHAMAQVEFKVKNSSTIDSEVSYQPSIVMIKGIDNAGTYTLPMAASITSEFAVEESHGSWTTSLSKDGVPHAFDIVTDYIAPGSEAVLITDAEDIHYVIPQKKDDAELIVTLGVKQGEHFINGVMKNVVLPVDWKEGHKYTYTLVVNSAIDPDLNDVIIDFDVTVDEMVIAPAQEIVLPN